MAKRKKKIKEKKETGFVEQAVSGVSSFKIGEPMPLKPPAKDGKQGT